MGMAGGYGSTVGFIFKGGEVKGWDGAVYIPKKRRLRKNPLPSFFFFFFLQAMNGAIEMPKADISNYAVTGLWREFGIDGRGW